MRKRRGVSMIEMVVVLAIILVMMAITLPVLLQAKSRVTGGVCYSNLKQVYQALELYSVNHGGGNLSSSKAVWPSDLSVLNLGNAAKCKHGGYFQPMWMYAGWNEHIAKRSNPVIVVDPNSLTHQTYSFGLYLNGNIERRRGEGDPTQFRYWE